MYPDVFTVFVGGIATVFTPCILPVIPVYLGIFANSGNLKSRFNILFQTLIFGVGFSSLFILMGLGAASISRIIISNKVIISTVGALIIILMGFLYSGFLKIPFLLREYRLNEGYVMKGGSRFTSLIAGIVFAAGWSPCAGPVLGSVLTFVALKSANIISGAILMGIFSLGILTPFIILSIFADSLIPKIKKIYRFMPIVQKAGGLMLIAGGLILLYSNLPQLSFNTKHIETRNLSIHRDKPEMLFVFSKSCPECKKLHTVLPDIREDCKGMDVEISEVYLEDEPYLKQRLGINVVPTIILYDSLGREIKRIFGSQNLIDLRVAAASIMNRSCAGEEPNLNRVRSSDKSCDNSTNCTEERFQ
ncbi:MAG: cytochrome c biogenesis protein CcdA [Myxococcota bacterium]